MSAKVNLKPVLPVLMAFFVMSFVDLVGIGVDRVSSDMDLSATLAQLIPSAALMWFLVLSVPVGVLQSRLGKKSMLNIGMLVTVVGLLVPFFFYSFVMVLAGCGGSGPGDELVIEFFDCASDGLSVAEGDEGNVIVAEEGFVLEPLLIISEEDIESWPSPSEDSSGYAELGEGEVASRLALLVGPDMLFTGVPDVDLMFRLTIGDESFWGSIQYTITGGFSSPACAGLGYPKVIFPGGLARLFNEFQLVAGGMTTIDGVNLADAARQAWSD